MRPVLLLLACLNLLQLKAATKDQSPVLETKYFRFYNNINLNTHLYLYRKAVRCKMRKTPNDSVAFVATEKTDMPLDEKEMELVRTTLLYYRDSLIGKDLLMDAEMSGFSDLLVTAEPGKEKMNLWQKKAWEKVKAFQVLYLKVHSRTFNRACADWVLYCKKDLLAMEDSVMARLQKIYGDTLPKEKIRVDLTNYATWAGAYSFSNHYCHIVIDAGNKNNQKEAGVEIVFHEVSHFLVDHLDTEIAEATKGKKINRNFNLWHNIIFYTTSAVLQPMYTQQKRDFTPYYVTQGFESKFPDFKLSVEAFKLYWDPYIAGKLSRQEALTKIVDHVLTH